MPTNTPVDRPTAIALLRAGHSAAETAQRLGCSTRTVERIRVDACLPLQRPQRPLSWDEVFSVELALADGASVAEALRSIGRSPRTSHPQFRGRGWTLDQVHEFTSSRRQSRRTAKQAGISL
jgi:hypothetical protein